MELVWLSIGSNLCSPVKQVKNAIESLKKLPKTKFLAHSSYYRSRPMGPKNQMDYLNVIVVLMCDLNPQELLNYIQDIEFNQGRIRCKQRWIARTIDIDILIFGKYKIFTDNLIVPHYDMYNREFIVYPLFELTLYLNFPYKKKLIKSLNEIPTNGLTFWNKN